MTDDLLQFAEEIAAELSEDLYATLALETRDALLELVKRVKAAEARVKELEMAATWAWAAARGAEVEVARLREERLKGSLK